MWVIVGGVFISIIILLIFLKGDRVLEHQTYQFNMEPKPSFHSPSLILSASDVINTDPIVDPKTEYTYTQMVEDLLALEKNYPGLVTTEVIGESVDGREIYAARLGYGETEIFISAATHAREWITTNLVMNQLDTYSQAFVENDMIDGYNVRKLLQNVSIYYVPMVNPDGVTLVQKGTDALSNTEFLLELNDGDSDFSHWKANARGVDLNRNYDTGWEHAHSDTGEPHSLNFKGYEPMSEPEVKAIVNFTKEHDFQLALSYHSSGEVLYWGDNLPSEVEDEAVRGAEAISEKTGYSIHSGSSGGMFSDWFAREFNAPGLTPEVAPYAGPAPVSLEHYDRIWEQNDSVGLLAAELIINRALEK